MPSVIPPPNTESTTKKKEVIFPIGSITSSHSKTESVEQVKVQQQKQEQEQDKDKDRNKGNILIGDSDEEAQKKDELLTRLASFAVSHSTSPNANICSNSYSSPPSKPRKYSSRFFFEVVPNGNTALDIEKIKQSHLNREQLVPVNKEIEDRKKVYEQQLSPELNKNLQTVREFFLTELAPKTFATDGGLNQVLEIVGEVVGEIDQTALKQFERLAHQAVAFRLCRFAAEYFSLSPQDAERLVELTVNQYRNPYPPNTSIIPVPVPNTPSPKPNKPKK